MYDSSSFTESENGIYLAFQILKQMKFHMAICSNIFYLDYLDVFFLFSRVLSLTVLTGSLYWL